MPERVRRGRAESECAGNPNANAGTAAQKQERQARASAKRQMSSLAAGFVQGAEVPADAMERLSAPVQKLMQEGFIVDTSAPEAIKIEAHQMQEHLIFQHALVARTQQEMPAFLAAVNRQEVRARTYPFDLAMDNRRARNEGKGVVEDQMQESNSKLGDEYDTLYRVVMEKERKVDALALELYEAEQEHDATQVAGRYQDARVHQMEGMLRTLEDACNYKDDEWATMKYEPCAPQCLGRRRASCASIFASASAAATKPKLLESLSTRPRSPSLARAHPRLPGCARSHMKDRIEDYMIHKREDAEKMKTERTTIERESARLIVSQSNLAQQTSKLTNGTRRFGTFLNLERKGREQQMSERRKMADRARQERDARAKHTANVQRLAALNAMGAASAARKTNNFRSQLVMAMRESGRDKAADADKSMRTLAHKLSIPPEDLLQRLLALRSEHSRLVTEVAAAERKQRALNDALNGSKEVLQQYSMQEDVSVGIPFPQQEATTERNLKRTEGRLDTAITKVEELQRLMRSASFFFRGQLSLMPATISVAPSVSRRGEARKRQAQAQAEAEQQAEAEEAARAETSPAAAAGVVGLAAPGVAALASPEEGEQNEEEDAEGDEGHEGEAMPAASSEAGDDSETGEGREDEEAKEGSGGVDSLELNEVRAGKQARLSREGAGSGSFESDGSGAGGGSFKGGGGGRQQPPKSKEEVEALSSLKALLAVVTQLSPYAAYTPARTSPTRTQTMGHLDYEQGCEQQGDRFSYGSSPAHSATPASPGSPPLRGTLLAAPKAGPMPRSMTAPSALHGTPARPKTAPASAGKGAGAGVGVGAAAARQVGFKVGGDEEVIGGAPGSSALDSQSRASNPCNIRVAVNAMGLCNYMAGGGASGGGGACAFASAASAASAASLSPPRPSTACAAFAAASAASATSAASAASAPNQQVALSHLHRSTAFITQKFADSDEEDDDNYDMGASDPIELYADDINFHHFKQFKVNPIVHEKRGVVGFSKTRRRDMSQANAQWVRECAGEISKREVTVVKAKERHSSAGGFQLPPRKSAPALATSQAAAPRTRRASKPGEPGEAVHAGKEGSPPRAVTSPGSPTGSTAGGGWRATANCAAVGASIAGVARKSMDVVEGAGGATATATLTSSATQPALTPASYTQFAKAACNRINASPKPRPSSAAPSANSIRC